MNDKLNRAFSPTGRGTPRGVGSGAMPYDRYPPSCDNLTMPESLRTDSVWASLGEAHLKLVLREYRSEASRELVLVYFSHEPLGDAGPMPLTEILHLAEHVNLPVRRTPAERQVA